MKIKTCQIESELVPSPVEFTVLLPEEYENSGETYHHMLFLHGGRSQVIVINGFSFLNRIINPLEESSEVTKAREFFNQMKENALRKDRR